MVTTDDPALDRRLRMLLHHGLAASTFHRVLGFTTAADRPRGGAIGRVQLRRLPGFNERRQENGAYLSAHLDAPGVVPPRRRRPHPRLPPVHGHGDGRLPLSRDGLSAYLREHGIGSAVHYPIPVHEQPLYQGTAPPGACPNATDLADRVLSLPVHPGIGPAELEAIVGAVNGVRP